MKFLPKVAWLLLLAAIPASAAEMAVLRNGFAIRHESREVMGDTTRLYLDAAGRNYTDVPTADIVSYEIAPPEPQPQPAPGAQRIAAAQPMTVDQAVSAASDKHDIDPDLINSVIRAESRYNPRAVSPKGAQGLMQLMPGTAAQLGVHNAFDAGSNVDGGTRYLHDLLVQYDGDMLKALAAYNAGPQAVQRYHGIPPYRETRSYVANVVRDFNRKKKAQEPPAVAPARKASRRVRAKPQPRQAADSAAPARAPGL